MTTQNLHAVDSQEADDKVKMEKLQQALREAESSPVVDGPTAIQNLRRYAAEQAPKRKRTA